MTSFLIVTHKLTNEVLKYSQQAFSWANLFSVRLLCSPPPKYTHKHICAKTPPHQLSHWKLEEGEDQSFFIKHSLRTLTFLEISFSFLSRCLLDSLEKGGKKDKGFG